MTQFASTGIPSLTSFLGKKNKNLSPTTLSLLKYIDAANSAAYKANQDRLTQAQGQLGGGFDSALKQIESLGQTRRSDITIGGQRDVGLADADAINRGIYNTQVRDFNVADAKERTGRQLTALDESLAGARANVELARGQATAGLTERVEDQYPDFSQFAQLISQLEGENAASKARKEETQKASEQENQANGSWMIVGVPPFQRRVFVPAGQLPPLS